jgi:hypothetical protein
MDVQKITHEVRLQQWGSIVKDCRSSGKSIKAWCAENSINIKTYYYWQKKVCQLTFRELSVSQKPNFGAVPMSGGSVFAEISVPKSNSGRLAVTIHHNNTEVNIYYGADAATVETAIQALRNLC